MFGLITAGLGVAQQVMGMVGQAKAAKGGGEGGGEQAAKADAPKKAEGAPGAGEGQGNGIEKFREMLNGPNVRSLEDIKQLRDKTLASMKPEQREAAEKKLNLAILEKLGLGKPGANGEIEVPLTPKAQQVLQQLGMKPDEIRDDAAAPGGAKAAPKPAPKAAALPG